MQSLRELYRIGRGPSSSHTMAPCRAAELFYGRCSGADRFEVTLFGSLAATGKGHLTDLAILSVLPPERTTLIWKPEVIPDFHPNGMAFEAFDSGGRSLRKWMVYSVGGGALCEAGGKTDSAPLYPFGSMAEIMTFCRRNGLALWQLAERHEDGGFRLWLDGILTVMMETLERGLQQEGPLPGGLGLARKARNIHLRTLALEQARQRTGRLAAYAYAVSEENASLGLVVTAPTCGSCGVLPAVLRYCGEELQCPREELLRALATAGIIGSVVRRNGSVSGAEVGCQGEIGTACAMAAAAAAYLFGGTVPQCEYAAEIGLEHFLGLTCDPVRGLVQIPCIERNAVAANRAVIASELALLSDGTHLVSFDDVVRAMLNTGHDLPPLYRETAAGGLSAVVAPL